MFENRSKCRTLYFPILEISTNFCPICLVTLFDCKLQVFKNSSEWTIIGIFNELLFTQNVARFARNIE